MPSRIRFKRKKLLCHKCKIQICTLKEIQFINYKLCPSLVTFKSLQRYLTKQIQVQLMRSKQNTQQISSARKHLIPFDNIYIKDSIEEQDEKGKPGRRRSIFAKYISNILNYERIRQNKQQSRLHLLSKINDRSYQQVNFKQTIYDSINKFLMRRIRLLNPDQTFMLLWNFLMLFAILFNFMESPVSIFLTNRVYQTEFHNPFYLTVNIVFIFGLFIDTLLIRFNLAFFRHGKIVTNRSQIFMNYLKKYFALDFIALVVYIIYAGSGVPEFNYIKLAFYLKVPTLMQINQQISFTLSIHRIRMGLYEVLKIILLIFLVTNWTSSIYFAIDYSFYQAQDYYYETGQLWLTNSNAVQNINLIQSYPEKWYIWYEYAIYWSFQISATIGYGNMTPRNPHQVLYCNFIILINTIMYSYFLNKTWRVISQLLQFYNKYIQSWAQLRQYLSEKSIPEQLSLKIGGFLKQMWLNEKENCDQEQFMKDLSNQLSVQLFIATRSKCVTKLNMFIQISDNFPLWSQMIKDLVFLVKKIPVPSSQFVFKVRDVDTNLYFLASGKIALACPQLRLGKSVHGNEHFGVYQFMSESAYITSSEALGFCVIWSISRYQLVELLKKNQEIYQKYIEMKQRIVFYGQLELCCQSCLKCSSEHHHLKNCPVINRWRRKIVRPYFIKKELEHSMNVQRFKIQRENRKSEKVRKKNLNQRTFEVEMVHLFNGYFPVYNI